MLYGKAMKASGFLVPNLLEALESTDGERAATEYLSKNTILLRWAFGSIGGHSAYVLQEFPIGISYKADFAVLTSWSGAWEVVFVELEPVAERLVTKQGVPTKRIAGAIKQIVDWDDYVIRNRASVQQDLADWCKKKDKLKWETKGREPSNYTDDRLCDAKTHVRFRYGLVAGRRNQITSGERTQALKFANRLDLNLRSYDAFVDIAEKLDSLKRNPNQTVSLVDFYGH